MQTATSETESNSRDLSICVHHYTLKAPCPEGQGKKSTREYAGGKVRLKTPDGDTVAQWPTDRLALPN